DGRGPALPGRARSGRRGALRAAPHHPGSCRAPQPDGGDVAVTPLARRLRAHRERGSALFITVMVITMLTAIGIFSMHAASLADQASGFNRQGVQTTYVAEFGARAVS